MATECCLEGWEPTAYGDWQTEGFIAIRQTYGGYRLHFVQEGQPVDWSIDGETKTLAECVARVNEIRWSWNL